VVSWGNSSGGVRLIVPDPTGQDVAFLRVREEKLLAWLLGVQLPARTLASQSLTNGFPGCPAGTLVLSSFINGQEYSPHERNFRFVGLRNVSTISSHAE